VLSTPRPAQTSGGQRFLAGGDFYLEIVVPAGRLAAVSMVLAVGKSVRSEATGVLAWLTVAHE
jgi:hypothetical protein